MADRWGSGLGRRRSSSSRSAAGLTSVLAVGARQQRIERQQRQRAVARREQQERRAATAAADSRAMKSDGARALSAPAPSPTGSRDSAPDRATAGSSRRRPRAGRAPLRSEKMRGLRGRHTERRTPARRARTVKGPLRRGRRGPRCRDERKHDGARF